MKCRYVGKGPEPKNRWAINASLAAVEQLLLADGQPFHRNFAAMAIASPAEGGHGGNYNKFLSEGLLYEAWIGDMIALREANWDYLENAKHKASTTWRTGATNGRMIIHENKHLQKEDSIWPGAIPSPFAVAATSALLPHQDETLSRIFCDTLGRLLEPNETAYLDYSPPENADLVDGTSFGHAPQLWW